MEFEALKDRLLANPNDPRPLNEALKAVLALEDGGQALEEFNMLLDVLFGEEEHLDTLRRSLDARMRSLKGVNEVEQAMLMAVGMRYWHELGAPDRAEAFLRKLQNSPDYQESLHDFYIEFYLGRNNWRRIEEMMMGQAGTTAESSDAAKVYRQLARLAGDKGETMREAQYLDKVFKTDPNDEQVIDRMIALNKASGRWHVVAGLLSKRAEACEDLERLADTNRELIRVYSVEMGVEAKALNVYQTWRDRDPENTEVANALLELLSKLRRWPNYVKLLKDLAEQETTKRGKKRRLIDLAETYIEQLRNVAEAIKALEAARSLDAKDGRLIKKLKDLYRERRDFQSYIALAREELADVEDPEERLNQLIELATLADTEIRRPDVVLPLWEDVLEQDPRCVQAQDALLPLYERTKAFDKLLSLLENRAMAAVDAKAQAEVYERIAVTAHTRLKDPVRAAEAWQQVLELDPDHVRAFAEVRKHLINTQDWIQLEQLFDAKGMLDDFGRILESQARKTEEVDAKAQLLKSLIRLYSERLGDPSRALRPMDTLMELVPGTLDLYESMASLSRSANDGKRLAQALGAMAPMVTDSSRQKEIYLELADIAQHRQLRPRDAFNHLKEAYRVDASDLELLDRLTEVATRGDAIGALLDVLEDLYPTVTTDEVTATRVAQVLARQAGDGNRDLERSVRFYHEVLKRLPDDSEALEALLEEARRNRDSDQQIYYLQRLVKVARGNRRLELLGQTADLQESQNDIRGAENTIRKIIAQAPSNPDWRERLERLFLREGDFEAVATTVSETIAALDSELGEKTRADAHARLSVAQLLAGYDIQDVIAPLMSALSFVPDHADATLLLVEHLPALTENDAVLSALERSLRMQEQVDALADLLEIRADRASGDELQQRLEQLHEIYTESLNDNHRAFRTIGRLLRLRPTDKALRKTLEEGAEEAGLWTQVVALYNELSSGVSTRARRSLLLRVADIEDEKLNDVNAAADALETIVESHPDDRKVLNRLAALYETHERSSDRARTMHRILPLTEGDEARAMRLELAALLCDPLGARDDAFELLKESESMWPNDLDVLRALHSTLQGLERADDEESILRKLAKNTEAPEKHELLVEAGFVSLRRLENAHEALTRVREVLEESEVHEGALSLCRNIFEQDEDIKQEAAQLLAPALRIIEDASGLVPVLETLEEHATSPHERASYHTELADLYLGPLESTVLGQVHLRTALEFTPGDMDLRDRLIVLARELDQLSDHVDVLDRVAELADEPILQVALVQEAAMLAAEELGDLEGGMNRHAKIIKEIDGENRLSLETLLNHTEQSRAFGSFLGWIDHALEVRFEADDRRPLFFRAVEAALANNQNSQALQYLDQAEGEFTDDLAFRRIHVEAARGAEEDSALTEALRNLADKTDDAEERAKSRMECAKLFAGQEDSEADAIAELNAYRTEHSDDREALELLVSLHKKVESHHDLVDNLKLLYNLLTPEEKSRGTSLALQIAQVLARELEQNGEALVWYETVLDDAPTHPEVVPDLETILKSGTSATEAYDLLDRAYIQLDDSESRVRIRETRAAQIEDSGPRSHLLREAAAMSEADLGDPQRALTNLMEVMGAQPTDADVRLRCRSLAAASGMPELLAGHLGIVADSVGEPDLVSTLLKERAQILLDPIGDVDGAIGALQSGLEANPGDGSCQEMLADLYDEHQRYEALAELLELRALHGADEGQKRSYLLRRADLLAGPLEDADEALMVLMGLMGPSDDADSEVVARMQALFNSGKCSEEIFPLLDQIYQAKGQTEELAQLLQTRADQLESEHDKTIALRRLGALSMSELADPARAARSYGLALRLDPLDEETKTAFEAACVESEKLPLYAKTLSEIADEMDDEMAKAEWMLQEARIRRDILGENEQAESIYRAVMNLAPDRLDSYYALETIFEEQARHAELAEILQGKSQLEEGDQRSASLHQLADLQTQELGNPEAAKSTLVDLLEAAPTDHDAHGKLQRTLSALGDIRGLAEALRAQAEVCSDASQQVDLLVQSASHLVTLNERDEARSVYEDALLVAPDRLDILRPLQSLVRDADEIDRLVELLGQELKTPDDVAASFQWDDQQINVVFDTTRKLAIYTELADLQARCLDDAYGAMQSLDAAVTIDPEAWDLWETLRLLSSEADQPDAEVRATHALLGSEQLGDEKRSVLLKNLAILRTDLVPDIPEAIASWKKYLEFMPTDRAGHEACAELLERAGNHEEFAAQLSRMYLMPELGYGEDARVELRLRQVDVMSNTLKRTEDAAELLETLITEFPHQEEPWHQLDRMYRTHDDPSLLASLLVRRVDRVDDKADAVAMLREAATIFSAQLGDHESSLAVLLDAVMKEPEDEALLDDALTEARAAQRLDAYVGVARETLNGLETEERASRTCTLATIMADEADMGYEAVGLLEEAVTELDSPIPVLELLCSQLSKQENIADEARYLDQLFEAQDDTMAKIGAARRRAMLLETHLDNLSGAIGVHESIVALEEGDKQALVALEELYFKMNQIPELIHTCERLIEVDVARQAELWQRIGMLQIEEMSDAKKAAEAFENVTTVDPNNLNSYRMLERAYGALEQWDALGDVYDRWAMAEGDADGRAAVYRKLAIVRESLEDHQGAVDAYTQALVSTAGDEESREALVRLHTKSGDYEEITYLFRDIIGRSDDQEVKVQLLERLAETHVEHLDSPEEGCQALSEVLKLAPDHQAAFTRWHGLAPKVFQADQRALFMEKLLDHTSVREAHNEIAMQLAHTLCHEVSNADRALQIIAKHLNELTGDARLLDLRADALEATGREDELKLVLEERLENTGDAPVIAEIRYRLGRMSLRDKNTDEAQQHFEDALRHNSAHRGVLSNLAAIYLDQDLATEADPLLTLLVQEMEVSDASAEERAYAHRLAGLASEKLLDNEQALHHLKQALSYTPEDPTLLLKVGCLAYEHGDNDLAQGTLNSILDAGYALNVSDQKLVHKTLGEVCLVLGDGNTARDHLLEVIALDPSDQAVIEELVELSLRYEDYEGALDDLRTLAGLRREALERYDILLRMADIAATKLDDADRSEGLLLEAVKEHSTGRAARVGLLKLYRSQERVMDAIRALESIADIEEDLDQKIEFYRSASQLAEENGDHALAVAILNQILDLDVSRFDHFAGIDRILTECRDWVSQEQNYKRMLERLKGSKGMDDVIFKLYTGLGEIYRSRLEDLYTAAEAFELALKVKPENPGTLEILTDLYRHMEDPIKTVDTIRRLARSNPGHAESLMELFLAGEDAADDETCEVASQVLAVLQKADGRVQSYYNEHIRSTMVQGAGNLDLASWREHLIPRGPATPVGDILAIVYKVLGESLASRGLKDVGLKESDRVDPQSKVMIASVLRRVSAILGLSEVNIYIRAEGSGIAVEPTLPPCVSIGSDMLKGKTEGQLAFLLAKHLSMLLPMNALAASHGSDELEGLIQVAELCSFGKTADGNQVPALAEAAETMRMHIDPSDAERLKKLLASIADRRERGLVDQYLNNVEVTSLRAGQLVSNNLTVASEMIQGRIGTNLGSMSSGDRIRELVRWMLSTNHSEARRVIGVKHR